MSKNCMYTLIIYKNHLIHFLQKKKTPVKIKYLVKNNNYKKIWMHVKFMCKQFRQETSIF